MYLFLAQHGKCKSGEIDPEKHLTQDGIEETEKVAEILFQNCVYFRKIIHSGKTRAKQTAEIFAKCLEPDGKIEQVQGMNPEDDVIEFSSRLDFHNVLYVGHLPFMEKMISFLVNGSIEPSIVHYANSGLACLEKKEKRFFLRWILTPHLD